MGISNERRHYLTLPDEKYKARLVKEAKQAKMSISKYIVYRLDKLYKIEAELEKANGREQT